MILLHAVGAPINFAVSTIISILISALLFYIYLKKSRKPKYVLLQRLGIGVIWILLIFFMFISLIYLTYIIDSYAFDANPFIILPIYIAIFIGVVWIYKHKKRKKDLNENPNS